MGARDGARRLEIEADERVRDLTSENAALRREVARAERQAGQERHLRRQVEALQVQVEQLRAKRKVTPPGPTRKAKTKSFARVVIPDSHGCLIDKAAAGAFLADLAAIRPAEIVMLGDHLDCGGFLSSFHALGWENERGYTYEEDIEATNGFLDAIQAAAPGASIFYLEGNHEHRVRRRCMELTQGDVGAFDRMMRALHAEHVLHLAKRGIRFFGWTSNHMGLRHPGTIKLGHCYFTHGLRRMPRNAAKKLLERYGANVIFGHTHKRQFWATRTVRDESLGAWCPGCLCELQPVYAETDVTEWAHGYGLQRVWGDGKFLHVNVPIIAGESFPPLDVRGGKR